MRHVLYSVVLLGLTAACAAGQHEPAPYAGMTMVEGTTLSADELGSLRRGEGMRWALPAELNRFPGPRHVLEREAELELSARQAADVREIQSEMTDRATALGSRIIEAERALVGLFVERAASADNVALATGRVGRLRGELQSVHLLAHLRTTELLSPSQVERYHRLRGYGG